jgi:hypothetical protein
MTLITTKKGYVIWARFDHEAQVYELFYDREGETYTGWAVDSLKDAKAASAYIIAEKMAA